MRKNESWQIKNFKAFEFLNFFVPTTDDDDDDDNDDDHDDDFDDSRESTWKVARYGFRRKLAKKKKQKFFFLSFSFQLKFSAWSRHIGGVVAIDVVVVVVVVAIDVVVVVDVVDIVAASKVRKQVKSTRKSKFFQPSRWLIKSLLGPPCTPWLSDTATAATTAAATTAATTATSATTAARGAAAPVGAKSPFVSLQLKLEKNLMV